MVKDTDLESEAARRVICARGADMNWREECRKIHDRGIEERLKIGPTKNAGIPSRLWMYDEPNKETGTWESEVGLSDAARTQLSMITRVIMPVKKPTAAIFQSKVINALANPLWQQPLGGGFEPPKNHPLSISHLSQLDGV